ncbi:hypothetical protein Agub_g11772, partial [Astrephomene gubernaculifera]
SSSPQEALPALRDVSSWVPHTMSVPPPLLAKAVVAALLNTLITAERGKERDDAVDMPSGMALSTDVADTLGRRVMDMVSYMQACELVVKKRSEVRKAVRDRREVWIAAR